MICAEDQVAKSKQDSAPSFKLRYASEVTVRVSEFHPLPSLQYLDVEALSSASKAKIDVGFFKSPCCERHVQAVIERGIVVEIELAPCPDRTALPPDAAALVKATLKRVRRGSRKWKPIPVRTFLANPAGPLEAETNCFTIRIFGIDFFCCSTDDRPGDCVIVEPMTVNRQ
jgi:hypothetical protein